MASRLGVRYAFSTDLMEKIHTRSVGSQLLLPRPLRVQRMIIHDGLINLLHDKVVIHAKNIDPMDTFGREFVVVFDVARQVRIAWCSESTWDANLQFERSRSFSDLLWRNAPSSQGVGMCAVICGLRGCFFR